MTPEAQVDERPLRERFAALEHPPETPDWAEVLLLTGPAVPAPARSSRRRVLLPLAAALVLAAAAGAALLALGLRGDGEPTPVSATGEPLAPLPAGPPTPGQESMQQVVAVTLDELAAEADVVFVGAVEAVGGSEPVPGAAGMTAHRVRFLVERPLGGLGEGLVDVTEPDSASLSSGYDFAPGQRYLVFAERRALDLGAEPALVPYGYMQGVFRVTGEDTAENDWLGEVRLSELEAGID